MKTTIYTKTIAALFFVFALTFTTAAQATTDANALYEKAVELSENSRF
jgi:predicted outer membrane protein